MSKLYVLQTKYDDEGHSMVLGVFTSEEKAYEYFTRAKYVVSTYVSVTEVEVDSYEYVNNGSYHWYKAP